MTLIHVGNSEGTVGRCDAKCYNASGADCHCICGGKNHGAGLRQARTNTQAMGETWLKKLEASGGYVDPEVWQKVLL